LREVGPHQRPRDDPRAGTSKGGTALSLREHRPFELPEPEIKLVFVCLFVLMVLADASNGHAVLPAFILGLAMSRHFAQHRTEQERIRVLPSPF
jgi:Kef-type K+ transport system membrane component KefB